MADPAVRVLLRDQWLAAIPPVKVITIYGVWSAVDSNSYAVYLTLNRPYVASALAATRVAILIPTMVFLTIHYGPLGAASALLVAASIATPIAFVSLFRLLQVSAKAFTSAIWRPLLGGMMMYSVVTFTLTDLTTGGSDVSMFTVLVVCIAVGAASYTTTVAGLWWMCGRPESIEVKLISRLRNLVR